MSFPAALSELQAAFFQATITAALCALCAFLAKQYRKPYLVWLTLACTLYMLRIGAILGFLATEDFSWLFVHQVLTGWTALTLLWAALLFSGRPRWRPWYYAVAAFPLVWSYFAIHELDNFVMAAVPAVLFLSAATLWTGWVFWRFHRRIGSQGALVLAVSFFLWGLHHLDYPILRARGSWNPWGYYLDSLFLLVTAIGILLLVSDELRRGLRVLSVLSGDLQRGVGAREPVRELLERPLALGGVRGSALFVLDGGNRRCVGALGACEPWSAGELPPGVVRLIGDAARRARPAVSYEDAASHPGVDRYTAVLPLLRDEHVTGALVITGDEGDPFAALGERFLLTLGQQVGAVLERAELSQGLAARTEALQRLAERALHQHETERRKISLELHDETAQLFSAVKMQLGLIRESADAELAQRVDRVVGLVDAGIRSIRSISSNLRPPLLDDLGALAALRALVNDFAAHSGLHVELDVPDELPRLKPETELVLFRALQEALSNVARHAAATRVLVRLTVGNDESVLLSVRDNGRGLDGRDAESATTGAMGLAGMRERIASVGGTMRLENGAGRGLEVQVCVPSARQP